MDISSLPESQQQQIKQLYQQFQEHHHQQESQQMQIQPQVQPQDYAAQPYDPSQYQAYDQSSYYSYYQYPQEPQQSQQNYAHQQGDPQYPYYPHDYAHAYQQQPNQHESAPVQSSGASVSQELAAEGGGGQGPNAYYPQGAGEQPGSGFPAPPGLNPAAAAAVAALSQLTQFAGSMGAAERARAGVPGRHGKGRGYGPIPMMELGPEFFHGGPGAMHPMVGPSLYRGGRRGGGPFQGRGRDGFPPHQPWAGGARPPLRGRGRGRGRGQRGGPRQFPSRGAMASTNAGPSAAGEEEPLSVVGEDTAPGKEKAVPTKGPSQKPWCELCRVDCTSMEILEQHKNGKKHKKNLQRVEELNKPKAEIQNEHNPTVDPEAEANSPAEAKAEENQGETIRPNESEKPTEISSEAPSDSQARKARGQFDPVRRGMKRIMRGGGGRGGKRLRAFEAPWHPVEPPRPKVVIPLICDLCNVKCDTQEVLNCHLSGKKHISKLKRFGDHQAMYGPMGLQALYPPNPIAHTVLLPQGHPQATYGPPNSFRPPGPYMPPQGPYLPPGADSSAQVQQNPNPQGPVATVESSNHASDTPLPEAQQQPHTTETENVSRDDGTLDSTVGGADNVGQDAKGSGTDPNYGVGAEDATSPGPKAQANEGGVTQ